MKTPRELIEEELNEDERREIESFPHTSGGMYVPAAERVIAGLQAEVADWKEKYDWAIKKWNNIAMHIGERAEVSERERAEAEQRVKQTEAERDEQRRGKVVFEREAYELRKRVKELEERTQDCRECKECANTDYRDRLDLMVGSMVSGAFAAGNMWDDKAAESLVGGATQTLAAIDAYCAKREEER